MGQKYDLTPEEWEERDKLFIKTMSDRGFVIEQIVEDGACLFRSISLQIYGDQDMHEIIRQQTMDYIVSETFYHCTFVHSPENSLTWIRFCSCFDFQLQNREYFMQFVTEDIDSYVSRKRNNHVHGNHIEIQAISEIFNRPVEIYAYHTGAYRRNSTLVFCVMLNFRPLWIWIWTFRTGQHIRFGANQRRRWAVAFVVPAWFALQCNFESIQADGWPWTWFIGLSNHRRITKC